MHSGIESIARLNSLKSALAFAGLMLCVNTPLLAAEFIPAEFTEEDSISKYVVFPGGTENIAVSVACRAMISKDGHLGGNSCFYGNDLALPYLRSVMDGADKARMKPATVDGQPEEVIVHYTVKFVRLGESTSIKATMNHGRYAAIYGEDYVDPQIISDLRLGMGQECRFVVDLVWVTMMVQADGTMLKPEVASKIDPRCRAPILTRVRSWKFIPATVAGKPVDAFYSHPLWKDRKSVVRLNASPSE